MPPHARTILGHLHRLAAPAASDAVLLTRWREQRDEVAFAELVARHGPMVLGVCRRVLGDEHTAEDAFQATFLVLARKAARVRRPESLPSFLFGVALRLARKSRKTLRRRMLETRADAPEPVDAQPHPLDALTGRELLALLDTEVARLPLLLCVMQGRTVEEAASMLGWSAGSLPGRLARGRKRLRERLTRRGLALSVGALALMVKQLGADAFAKREKASAELERFGPNAVPGVRARLGCSAMPKVRRRLRAFLERYDGHSPAPYQLLCVRGVAALEAMNTAAAQVLLAELAKGPADDSLTREARAASRRRGAW